MVEKQAGVASIEKCRCALLEGESDDLLAGEAMGRERAEVAGKRERMAEDCSRARIWRSPRLIPARLTKRS